ncbi:MAG: hypothetical protein AMXMBFR25_04890 [Lysobacterales bacterium]
MRSPLLSLMLLAAAAAAAADGDHPLLSAYPGSTISKREALEFAEYQRIVGMADDASQTEQLAGRLTRIRYRNPQGRSTLEIAANYRQALEGAGLRVDYECVGRDACASSGIGWRKIPSWDAINGMNVGAVADVRYFTGRLRHAGGEAYVAIAINPNVHHVHILEVQAMQQGLVVADAAVLGSALDHEGRVVVDGIYFDTDSARLQPASDAALQQVAKLLGERPALKLHVVGHTDSQGGFAHNQKLSAERAASVVAALTQRFGIAAARLAAHGVGPLAPAAGNGSDAGRARNRRVEIVVQ